MSFYLVRLDRNENNEIVETPIENAGTFDKGSDAAKAAKAHEALSGVKVQCRRIAQAADWRGPFHAKVASGEYRMPQKWDLEPVTDHFAHLDDTQPGLISFVASEADGIIGRLTLLTPGRYLSRYFEDMEDSRRRKLIASVDPSGEILFARTAEEIEHVYKNGPSSCMDGEHNLHGLPIWPTSIYGAGDLAVAYTFNGRGRIQSRALCWPEKKVFGRTYGAEERIQAALEAEGMRGIRVEHDPKVNFHGAKLMKVAKGDGNWVMPYFDDMSYAVDKGDHFEIVADAPKDEEARWVTSGRSQGCTKMQRFCPRVEHGQDEDGFIFVNGPNKEWSQLAVYRHTFTCEKTLKLWCKEYLVHMGNNSSWSKEAFAEHGAVCSHTQDNWPKDQMVTLPDGAVVHKSCAAELERQTIKPRDHYAETAARRGRDSYLNDRDFRQRYEGRWAFTPHEPEVRAHMSVDGTVYYTREPRASELMARGIEFNAEFPPAVADQVQQYMTRMMAENEEAIFRGDVINAA